MSFKRIITCTGVLSLILIFLPQPTKDSSAMEIIAVLKVLYLPGALLLMSEILSLNLNIFAVQLVFIVPALPLFN